MTLEIHPGQGLGNLKFGMTISEVKAFIDQEEHRSVRDDVTEIYFENYLNLAFCNDALYRIGATRYSSGITFKGIDIFAAEPLSVLKVMEAEDGEAFENYGFIVFLKLGVSLTGFHDDDLDNKALTVAVLVEWQALRNELTPISFLS
ncbi:hypothetical protein RU07_01655 [Agrobacterium tumefaciens]|uniref:Uncharacterized protein n=1 Tax=Agrobacterium tumefaciens TaxID=358 RepID=A0A0D0L3W6_AGRTU|nr:hypothetical protein RU07_01655 [Agrobacterium tumefaciens]